MNCGTSVGMEELTYFPRLSQSLIYPEYGPSPFSPIFPRAFGSLSGSFSTTFSFADTPFPFKDEQDLDPFHAYSFSFNNSFDTSHISPVPLCPLSEAPENEETTVRSEQLFLDQDKRHARAEDAIKARLQAAKKEEAPSPLEAPKEEQVEEPVPPREKPKSCERSLWTEERQVAKPKMQVVTPISMHSRTARNVSSPSKKGTLRTPSTPSSIHSHSYTSFQQMASDDSSISSSPPSSINTPSSFISTPSSSTSATTPPSSSSSSPPSSLRRTRDDSDYELDPNDDDVDYLPTAPRLKKRQKRTDTDTHDAAHDATPCKPRRPHSDSRKHNKKTQLQIVLEDLPYTMDDIVYANGHYHCPFPNCFQSTTSEGDLGRHLESSAHATHRYVCLSVGCLEQFAREDSMKRHHANNRGKYHKAEHDRTVKNGFPFRVRISQTSGLKERVMAWARAEGRL